MKLFLIHYRKTHKLLSILIFSIILKALMINAVGAQVEYMTTGQTIINQHDTILFTGKIRKWKTNEPRSLGGADFLTNSSNINYRISNIEYTLNNAGLNSGEMSETDIGVTILKKDQLVALNSGEEMLVTHHYNKKSNSSGFSSIEIPSGGFLLKPNYKLSISSTSGIHVNDGKGPVLVANKRLDDGEFLSITYKVKLIREDLALEKAVTSYRSPYRDRIYVANSGRAIAPYTSFKNTSNNILKAYSLNIFLSNITSSEPSNHFVELEINGNVVKKIILPAHKPGISSKKIPFLIPINLYLNPNDVISIKGSVLTKKSIIFDYASFLIADYGLVPINERLNFLDVDLNNDGFFDIVDLDAMGSVWVSIRVGNGLQESQQEWVTNLIHSGDFIIKDINNDNLPDFVIKNNGKFCFNLRNSIKEYFFVPSYCSQSKALNLQHVWGDFNGDGWPDLLTINSKLKTYIVSLGTASGLSEGAVWATGYGNTDIMSPWDINNDNMTDLVAEWSDKTGPRCLQFISTGKSFTAKQC